MVLLGRRGRRLETLHWVEDQDPIMEEVQEVQVVLHLTQMDHSLDREVHNLDLDLAVLQDPFPLYLEDRMDLHRCSIDLPHLHLLDLDNPLPEDDLPPHLLHLLMMKIMSLLMSMMLIQSLRTTLMNSMTEITNFFAIVVLILSLQ